MMKKIILSIILALIAALTATSQDKLIRVAEKSTSWRKDKPKATLFGSEMARLLMPQGAAFGVECIPSFAAATRTARIRSSVTSSSALSMV